MLEPDALVLDGRFRVLRRLGTGGMGEVYLAEQVSLKRQVALKVLRQDLSVHPAMAERFHREALLLSSVDHPAVVRVIEFGHEGSSPCLVMELAEGESLRAALMRGPLRRDRALALLCQLLEGLVAIHHRGIVHRDLKPDNVILSWGPRGEQARLLDFGIARLALRQGLDEPADGPTVQGGLFLGTPQYVAPEQAMGAAVDVRTDVYAWGVLAYEMLSGVLPFPGPTPQQFLAQHIARAPTPLTVAAVDLADATSLCALIMRCLEKEPVARPQTATELLHALLPLSPMGRPLSDSLETTLRATHLSEALSPSSSRDTAPTLALPSVLEGAPAPARPMATSPMRRMMTDVLSLNARAIRALERRFWIALGFATVLLGILAGLGAGAWVRKKSDASAAPPSAGESIELPQASNGAASATWSSASGGEAQPNPLIHMAEAFARTPRDARLERLLRSQDEQALLALAQGEHSQAQWGALRYLDWSGRPAVAELVSGYARALVSPDCAIRAEAATRLGELGTGAAVVALEQLLGTQTPTRCGQAEAGRALQLLKRRAVR